MKNVLLVAAAGLLLTAAASVSAASSKHGTTVCWLETSASTMDPSMGGAGISETRIWHSTIALVPAHDRDAFTKVFGNPSTCISTFPSSQGDPRAE
jgi:hypothetical protein